MHIMKVLFDEWVNLFSSYATSIPRCHDGKSPAMHVSLSDEANQSAVVKVPHALACNYLRPSLNVRVIYGEQETTMPNQFIQQSHPPWGYRSITGLFARSLVRSFVCKHQLLAIYGIDAKIRADVLMTRIFIFHPSHLIVKK